MAEKDSSSSQVSSRKSSQTFFSGLHWYGKTKDGVHKWRGTLNALPAWLCNAFKFGGGAFIVAGGIAAVVGGADPAAWVLPSIGGIYVGLGFWLQRLRTTFNALTSVEELAKKEGVPAEEVIEAIHARGIRPKINLNDEDMYDPSDVSGVASLLRPAVPDTDENLLRPAGCSVSGEPVDQLLRPIDEEEKPISVAVIQEEAVTDQTLENRQ